MVFRFLKFGKEASIVVQLPRRGPRARFLEKVVRALRESHAPVAVNARQIRVQSDGHRRSTGPRAGHCRTLPSQLAPSALAQVVPSGALSGHSLSGIGTLCCRGNSKSRGTRNLWAAGVRLVQRSSMTSKTEQVSELLYMISARFKPVFGILFRYSRSGQYGRCEQVAGACLGGAQPRFEFAKRQLDVIKVRRVWRQVAQACPVGFHDVIQARGRAGVAGQPVH